MPRDFERADNSHRAPMRREFKATTEAPITTATFVSAVDDTPRNASPPAG